MEARHSHVSASLSQHLQCDGAQSLPGPLPSFAGKGDGAEALKKAQDEFDRLVTVIFEEFSADDVAQHGKELSANYFKHLLDVRNGGQVRVRNVMLHFRSLQPRIICVNDTPKEWLRAIEGVKDTDKLPLEKRVLFVHVDELVISPAAVAAYEADLDEIVSAGKRRRLEHYSAADIEISSTIPIEEPSTSAGSSYVSGKSDADSVRAFDYLWSSDESSDDEGSTITTITRPLQGREQAALDYKRVESVVKEVTEGNMWIRAGDHWKGSISSEKLA